MNQSGNWQDTIVALATPAGIGALGIIRLSGANALAITDGIFKGKKLSDQQSHTLHFGAIMDANNEVVDEVVVSVYKKGRSFTGEESTEIACHGSPYIIDAIIRLCIAAGARLAQPGEFTQRAFLNGRMDLAQAEAVADLIAAENKAAHHIALNQMRGGISNELHQLRDKLIHFTALVELELDFAEEDVEFADRTALSELISNLKSQISNLISTFEYGNAIKKGVPVAIIGMPNAGKSTLLNALLKEERAIVSDIAGTTRDVIEEAIVLDGITFRFIDTAGIRETVDTIEAIGVARAKEKVQQADVIIHLYEKDHHLLDQLEESLEGKLVFNLVSKTDVNNWANDRYEEHLKTTYPQYHHFGISVRTGFNIDRLVRELVDHYKTNMAASSVIITNARHKEALVNTLLALENVEHGMQQQLSGDLLAFHLRDALRYLGSITGQIETDRDILGAIFSKFCIGK